MNPPKLGAQWHRDQLSSPESRRIYDCIDAQLARKNYCGKTSFQISPDIPPSAIFDAYTALRLDRPEYFFLGMDQQLTRCPTTRTGSLTYSMLYNPGTIVRVQKQLERGIRRITFGTDGLSGPDKAAMIYERIATGVKYRERDTKDARDYNVVSPLLYHEGVCRGISALLTLCLRAVQIPCIRVSGGAGTGPGRHCWNVCYIDGTPVHLDVTWDLGKTCQYEYFALSGRQIREKRHYDFTAPMCIEERYAHYNHDRLSNKFKYA